MKRGLPSRRIAEFVTRGGLTQFSSRCIFPGLIGASGTKMLIGDVSAGEHLALRGILKSLLPWLAFGLTAAPVELNEGSRWRR